MIYLALEVALALEKKIRMLALTCYLFRCVDGTITFKLFNNLKIYICFHVKICTRYLLIPATWKYSSFFFPLRQIYVPFEIVQFAVKRTLDLECIMQPCVFPCRRIVSLITKKEVHIFSFLDTFDSPIPLYINVSSCIV